MTQYDVHFKYEVMIKSILTRKIFVFYEFINENKNLRALKKQSADMRNNHFCINISSDFIHTVIPKPSCPADIGKGSVIGKNKPVFLSNIPLLKAA